MRSCERRASRRTERTDSDIQHSAFWSMASGHPSRSGAVLPAADQTSPIPHPLHHPFMPQPPPSPFNPLSVQSPSADNPKMPSSPAPRPSLFDPYIPRIPMYQPRPRTKLIEAELTQTHNKQEKKTQVKHANNVMLDMHSHTYFL